MLKRQRFYSSKKEWSVLSWVVVNRKCYEKGTFFVKNGLQKGKGLDIWAESSFIEICWPVALTQK